MIEVSQLYVGGDMDKNQKILELYQEYKEYRADGLSHKEALDEFKYLHSITLSRLIKYIEDNHINGNKKEEAV